MSANLVKITGEIVSAYVTGNHVSAVEIPTLLNNVHAALTGLANGTAPTVVEVEIEKPSPAQIRKSVRDDGIVSFIDGKTYKTLKRHLSANGLDPRSYRERYGLPADYPMIAPSYAEQRSAIAKAIGLGRPGAMAENSPKDRRKVA
ncbi:MucR family transcriptional regulator [Methylobacterium sp. UNCCL125]|jgi:predicted transcriptional regulator|uniref:MucR family transcriptional regulator n=3 Tax=unclassified Methylobacterium TaxID=2615210 RepID=UPI0008E20386|nr:MucR family transcriptional regulator [Methylobacterium sp. UNCCL125]SFV13153.1 transcriptional regulator, MucR family [Methylobacterium sp. UNCCL125]